MLKYLLFGRFIIKMKKFFTVVLLLAFLALPIMAADVIISAPKTPIIIDGVRDDGYGDFVDIKAMESGIPGATGKVCTAWDDNFIYYYIEVLDSTPNHNAENSYERDCVEFYIDWFNNKGTTFANDGKPYWQIRIASAPSDDGVVHTNMINGETDVQKYIDAVAKTTFVKLIDGGYIIEVGMPIDMVEGGFTMSEGLIIGVEFLIGDNQIGAGGTSMAFLTEDDMDTQWENPSGCHGLLKLGAPVVVVEEVETLLIPETITAVSTISPVTGNNLAPSIILIIVLGITILILKKRLIK